MDIFTEYEFGGPIGALAVMLFSHFIVYYLWICLAFNDGAVLIPTSLTDWSSMLGYVREYASPTWWAAKIYLGFLLVEGIFGVTLPGFRTDGLPVRSEGWKRLPYLCNAFQSWWLTLIGVCAAQFMGWINMASIVDHHGELLTMSIIVADSLAIYVYLSAYITRKVNRASGNVLYDTFMGINLNPRIGILDIKLFCEVRISWMILFFLTFSAACKQYQDYGYVANSMIIMLIAHLYYCNACCKGEERILACFDIIHENFGWMLAFWNLAGVPFSYCFNSMFLARHAPLDLNWGYFAVCVVVLLFAAWIHDTGNSQKNTFRQVLDGTFVQRNTFPQLPWGVLKNPKYMQTECGSKILIDGWFKYARKLPYTADIAMALIWGMSCEFTHLLPYFYFIFFVGMISHRYFRDVDRMQKKYGKDYKRYCEIVPYVFVPGIY
eukprot:CAMPEP_0117446806 /NCGR_PEP_ID=MMETSP0759-20121206/6540_1 /TAXON_ID=63605 /ORGANISM="Percolomonas cosmopolitus, Strain WS" /LENGTH=435 /DNA_ID=CAMNT_0005239103 /DNA_START=1388 /DNA_END=2695 /DNA_ORIENTATION=+